MKWFGADLVTFQSVTVPLVARLKSRYLVTTSKLPSETTSTFATRKSICIHSYVLFMFKTV
ncbi:hypothetical protein Scep_020066 [Stephania cephalantha]|uniref:Uncharacterized protein n=1 Tax=Stephania cephalantha TaxID=152367 RepID=A0AAP0ICG7_9MAGN